jgi:hypothetical protein
MTGTPPPWLRGLDREGWERVLMNGADEKFLVEAAARLIARHGYWLGLPEFAEFLEFYPPDAAGIWYKRAAQALDDGRLPVRDQEDANVLRLAASLVVPYRVSLGEVIENNSAETIALIAEAMMYADGFLSSRATPMA